MKLLSSLGFAAAALSLSLAACSSDDSPPPNTAPDAKAVTKAYATLVSANYDDSLAQARALKTAVDAFLASPTQATFDAAKKAWIDARPSYGQTEVYRFYGGPIDEEETGPEGRINSWPIDEAYVDYTLDAAGKDEDTGLINDATELPEITKDAIAAKNQPGELEANVSTGWHAIEFLLWGQDLKWDAAASKVVPRDEGPGVRPYTDYVVGTGTHKNQERRRAYLAAVTELLVEDIASVADQWKANATNYSTTFIASAPTDALSKALTGLGNMSRGELSKERMNNAYETKDQEEEHSCFSDTTTNDLLANARGIENVYFGRYGSVDGPGFDELVRAKDPALDAEVKQKLAAALAAIQAIPAPFDGDIAEGTPGRPKVKAGMDALVDLSDSIAKVAAALGLTIKIE